MPNKPHSRSNNGRVGSCNRVSCLNIAVFRRRNSGSKLKKRLYGSGNGFSNQTNGFFRENNGLSGLNNDGWNPNKGPSR